MGSGASSRRSTNERAPPRTLTNGERSVALQYGLKSKQTLLNSRKNRGKLWYYNSEIGTAYSESERIKYRVEGLLPFKVEVIESQAARCLQQLDDIHTSIHKYVYLSDLKQRNETLFYFLVVNNLKLLLPIVYTPTVLFLLVFLLISKVGEGCLQFSHIWKYPDGMFFNPRQKNRIRYILDNWDNEVDIIVVRCLQLVLFNI